MKEHIKKNAHQYRLVALLVILLIVIAVAILSLIR